MHHLPHELGGLGLVVGIEAGSIADKDAALAGGFEVDVIVVLPGRDNQFQLEGLVDRGFGADDDVAAPASLRGLFRLGEGVLDPAILLHVDGRKVRILFDVTTIHNDYVHINL